MNSARHPLAAHGLERADEIVGGGLLGEIERLTQVDRRLVRAIALASQPVLEIIVIETNDSTHLENRKRIRSATRHIPAPALRTTKGGGDAFPGFDEIRHVHVLRVLAALCRGRAGVGPIV